MNKPGAKYYEGKIRLVKGGLPIRAAAWAKELSPVSQADLYAWNGKRSSKFPVFEPVGGATQQARETQAAKMKGYYENAHFCREVTE